MDMLLRLYTLLFVNITIILLYFTLLHDYIVLIYIYYIKLLFISDILMSLFRIFSFIIRKLGYKDSLNKIYGEL